MMKKMTSAEIRSSFLEFFREKEHLIVPSASLIPLDDPTLLFTNAGMNQFKDSFLGLVPPPASRVADAQKCMRVSGKHNDLEDVGPSPYHHTFFEMLGNWSFGDYYKREAIRWAWELLTNVWEFPSEHLYSTVFKDEEGEISTDLEAVEYWKNETDIDTEHILFFGRKDNFWEMGDTGPCGPCSEIHFDRGTEFCDMTDEPGHVCAVNGECARFIELWNLVFIQYNALESGELELLPDQHVDTGMGFERVAMVIQGGRSNYDTDLFTPIFRRTRELAGQTEEKAEQSTVAYRVIADHARAAAFLVGDGVLPGSVGRGYVLRMIIRRAARFGRKLGLAEPFLARVAEAVIENMGNHYRELRDRREHISQTITQEEKRFMRTLDQGLARLDQLLSELSQDNTILKGRDAFDLYTTYGLPVEITRDVAAEHGYSVDEDGFQTALSAHRDLSSSEQADTYGAGLNFYADLLEQLKAEGKLDDAGVKHRPYGNTKVRTPVIALVQEEERVQSVKSGEKVNLILPETPFYVEAGGQVSDSGMVVSADGVGLDWKIQITEMRRPLPGLILHIGRVLEGQPEEGDLAVAQVNSERRLDIMRNHTATHLLHRALRRVLGTHVQQAGSLVAPDRLRFDFTHHAMLTQSQLDEISRIVNDAILANYPLHTAQENYQAALENGVIALFGEKYGDMVRVVRVGDSDDLYSQELCGGTHVAETGDIGLFHIRSEGSVGAGVRRIEAVTGRAAQALVRDQLQALQTIAATLGCPPEEVVQKVESLIARNESAQVKLQKLGQKLAYLEFEELMRQAQHIDDVALLAARVQVDDPEMMRQMTDWFRDKNPVGVVVLGTLINERPQLVAALTPNLVERGLHAGNLVKRVAQIVGGGGGGRPTLAQAGGRDASRLDEALDRVPELVQEMLQVE
jgi:alanyl-tRNA synthetase